MRQFILIAALVFVPLVTPAYGKTGEYEAVVAEPNRAGRTMVWPLYGYSGVTIRCFMPGSMT